VFPITIPPLRDRAEDIPELARHFMVRFAAEEGKRVRSMPPEALRLLLSYSWPGNVRQLENAVFRAVVLAEGEEIGLDEFPQIAVQACDHDTPGEPPRPHAAPIELTDLAPVLGPSILLDDPTGRPSPEGGGGDADKPSNLLNLVDHSGHARPLDEIEAEAIKFALSHYRNQMSEVARRLRIGRSTLYRKLDALGLVLADGAGP
jgi:DNA-binding NtrC family response regulator